MTQTTVRLHVAEWSAAPAKPPLLLLHGLANRWQATAPLVPELARRWHVLAPDLRGHGRSPRADRYTVGLCALDVAAEIAERRLGPVVVFGHSLGGLVGLMLAAGFPGSVRAVVVGDSAVLARSHGARSDGIPPVVARLAGSAGPLPKGVDPEVMEAFRDGRLLGDYDGPAVLRRVGCPVLLLRGAVHLGAHLNRSDSDRAVSLLADGQQAEIAGVGHQLQITHRRAVLAALGPFLGQFEAGPVVGVRAA